ncbi:MAG: pyridoxal phosphate-dependent aminotransferase [Polyangiaceae bacterium]
MFSRRSSFEREPNRIHRALEQALLDPRELVDLTLSNPTDAGLPYAGERIRGALGGPDVLHYEPAAFGLELARQAVVEELGRDGICLVPERVLLTASTSEAYGYAFALLCDPGDAVLVPAPSYPLLDHLARLASVRLVPYRLAYDGAWHIDVPSLRQAMAAEQPKAVFTVSPNNPTGHCLKRSELEALEELALPIVSDEVFARYPLKEDRARVKSALEATRTLVLALGGLSKLAALPQLKLSWMLLGGPDALVEEARARLEVIADAHLSVAAPVQHALAELFTATRETVEAIRVRTRGNLERLRGLARDAPLSVLDVEAGWYAVLRVPRVLSEEDWVIELLSQARVRVQPGYFFDFVEEPFLVVSLLCPEDSFGRGARALVRHVRNRAA